MSVRKGDRDQGKLQCLEASKELIKYTYDRVKDNDIFPKNQRWLMAKTIWDAACGAHTCIIRANAIKVECREDADVRLNLVKQAIGHLDVLNGMIDICNVKGQISDDRAEFWTGLATKTENMVKAWLKAQRTQYKPFLT